MFFSDLLQTTIFGLATGGVVAISAVGLTLSYGVTRFINFAYGEILTIGAFTAFALARLELPLLAAILLAVLLTGFIGVGIAKIFYDPLRGRSPFALLLTSVGVAFILQNLLRMGFGANPKRFPVPLLRPWIVGDLFVPKLQVVILLTAVACMLLLHLVLTRSMMGKMMRAASDNDDLARVSGINTRKVIRATWWLSSAVGGLGGVLLGVTQITIRPVMGWSFLLVVFAATLLGGIGSPYGAMLGALIVGLGIEFGATYLSPDYAYALAFGILVLTLLFRPTGLMGGARG